MAKYGDFVSRVDQVDANELNTEIYSIFKSQISLIFKYLKPDIITTIEPELNAILRFVICKYSLQAVHASIGQQLLLIKYIDTWTNQDPSSFQMTAYIFCIVASHWLKERRPYLGLYISRRPRLMWMHKLLDWSEIFIRCSSIVNFLIFLQNGRYLSVLERLLCIRSVPAAPHNLRHLLYQYMMREILWHGFTEFLTVVIPLLNTKKIQTYINKYLPKPKVSISDDIQTCGICGETPCLPHLVGCKHIFCYFCIKTYLGDDSKCVCPVCNYTSDNGSVLPLMYT